MRLTFDSGTIVLGDPPPDLDVDALPGVLWDARVGRHRARALAYSVLRDALARGGTGFADDVRSVEKPPGSWKKVALRPYQETAIRAWTAAGRRGVIVLPTGSGKTRVAIAAMARTGMRTLCLVPTRVLIEQWHARIAEHYDGTVGRCGDGRAEFEAITVATFESAYRRMGTLGNRFDLLVVDEAHHFGCGLRDEALEMSIADARLGLTATPPRATSGMRGLAALLGPIVFDLAVGDLAGSFLSHFDVLTVRLELSDDERTRYDAWLAAYRPVFAALRRLDPTASFQDLHRAAARTSEGRRALHAFRQARRLVAFTRAKRAALGSLVEQHRDGRLLVFTADNDTAYSVARENLVMPITCDIGRKERDEALERFRAGELRALVSARVLNEGLDVPDADVAVIVGAAHGEREHVQRVGRLLRPAPGKRALVYELVTRATFEVDQARRRRAGLDPRGVAPA